MDMVFVVYNLAPFKRLFFQEDLVGGQFGRALPLLVFGSATVGAGLLCIFLPETLHKHLPETLEDAKMFGRSVSGSLFSRAY